MREIDVAFLSLALIPHDVDFVTGLEPRLALEIEHFGKRQHALGLRADIHHHVRRGKLQHRALEDFVLAHRFFTLGGKALQSRGEVFGAAGLFVLSLGRLRRLGHRSRLGRTLRRTLNVLG